MFLEYRFAHAVDRLRARAAVPLRLILWNGQRIDFSPRPTVTVSIPELSALRYFISPDLSKLGEAFVEGHIRVEGSIHEVFRIAEKLARVVSAGSRGARRAVRHSSDADRRAIEYHYDVSDEFYALFLDTNMTYSCAYYREPGDSLDKAQQQKLDHILNKLRLRPDERFLDIGCGWGALIIRAAQRGANAKGITLSRNQYEYARMRIRAEGLEERCSVELCDYRALLDSSQFDKIASVGMFEHVGLKNLPLYFDKVQSLLKPGGLALNHGITASDVDSRWVGLGAGEFINRYVFPGGELPHLALVVSEMSRAGLEIADVESLRRHYARTCREWADRLERNRARAAQLAGAKRMRIWEIYLAGCAHGFDNCWMNLYQILAAKQGGPGRSLPLTREYMYACA